MKRFNINEFIWFLILFSFTLFLSYILYAGKLSMFIHPKMHKNIVYTILALSLITVFQFTKVFTIKRNEPLKTGYLLFVIFLLGGIAVSYSGGLNSGVAKNREISLNFSNINSKNMKNLRMNGDKIVLKEENYVDTIVSINNDLEKFKGKNIVIEGFVYRDNNLKENHFITGRFTVACCAADAQVIGMICSWSKATTLNNDIWVRVEGVIDSGIYYNSISKTTEKKPVIMINKVEEISKPENPYIY